VAAATGGDRRLDWPSGALAALVALAPFLRGLASGASFYFRDLSLYFLPVRRYAVEGLARGEVRLWNPFVHEGVPLSLPALGYPVDLLQLVRPDEAGLSLVLALHVPLAAAAFVALARGLSLGRVAAVGGGIAYALGGFLLSSLNLYVHLQAAAWAPLLVLGLVRVLGGGSWRSAAATALLLATALSTTGVEIVVQALLVGLALGWALAARPRRVGSCVRTAAALALGVAAAAPVLLLVAGQVEGSARARGLPTDVVLAHSVHPFTFVQVVVSGLYGNPANLANEWWGQNFFPRGFPYVLSLYMGAAVLALAAVGATSRRPATRALGGLCLVALVVSAGRWAGLAPLVDALPGLRLFRFPVKAFFTAHLAVCLLASTGLAALVGAAHERAWRRLLAWAAVLGGVLALLPLLQGALPGPMGTFAARFFPPGLDAPLRAALMSRVLLDAASGGLAALLLAATSVLVLRGALAPSRGAWLGVAVVTADLFRAGAGLNPMVSSSFFEASPELAAALPVLREGRVFTCSLEESPEYQAARRARGQDHELWTFATAQEAMTPFSNLRFGVATALSPDLTMLVPEERVLSPEEASCRDLDRIVPRLQAAGVRRVLSASPLDHPDLVLEGALRPARTAPIELRVYATRRPLPFLERVGAPSEPEGRVVEAGRSAGRIEALVESRGAARLVVREGWAAGWRATVDGRPVAVERTPEAQMALRLRGGRERVLLRYWPTRLGLAVWISAAALLATAALAWPWRGRRRPA
jgi:hypothetical protein